MMDEVQLRDIRSSSLPFIHLECQSSQSANGETVVLLLPEFFSLKRNKKGKGKKKKQHTHFKIPPKKPAVSLIIMEENLG